MAGFGWNFKGKKAESIRVEEVYKKYCSEIWKT